MTFTVSLPSGMRDFEYWAYMRMLEREGINIVDTPRVHDPQGGNRWLHAWSDRATAEEFASQLRTDTKNPAWQVYELPGEEPTQGPLGPVEVLMSRQSDGYTYGLGPWSHKLIRQKYPQTRLAPRLFIAADTRDESGMEQEPVWDQVTRILTGLPEAQIDELGGYRVFDLKGKRVLREAPAFARSNGAKRLASAGN